MEFFFFFLCEGEAEKRLKKVILFDWKIYPKYISLSSGLGGRRMEVSSMSPQSESSLGAFTMILPAVPVENRRSSYVCADTNQ